MTEAEYIVVSELTRVRAALTVLRDICAENVAEILEDGSIVSFLRSAVESLDNLRSDLEKAVKISQ